MNDDRALERLADIARRRDGRIDPAADAAERERLVAALPVRRARRKLPLLAAAMVLGLVAAFFTIRPRGDEPLSYAVEGTVSEQGYVQAGTAPVAITFSDGSRFVAQPQSAGRVIGVDAAGARLLLERGTLSASVVHADDRAWSIAAGPYVVRVTGTQFDLSWVPEREELSLTLKEGKVAVSGPMLEGELSMQAGQTLVVRLPERHFQVRATAQLSEPSEPAAVPSVAPTPAPPPPEPPPAAPPPARVTWSRLVADGEYDRVLAEAEARGIDSVLSAGSVDDVVALGDAARYRGRGDVARKALSSLWERFPDTRAGKSAAFLIGRLSEGSPSAAIGWYDRYLAADPGGPYAAEAAGRKLELLARTNRSAARVAAQQYLAAYPNGAYAAFARELLR